MDALGGAEEDADDDEGQHGAYLDQLARLKTADDATRTMTHEQYLFYSECRQASFTYKKPKKFKDWSTLQLHPGARSNVDVVETLGFLAHEIVSQLTETSLAVKAEWDTEMLSKKRKHVLDTDALEAERSLFAGENKNQTPIQAQHVFEAYRRLEEAGQAVHPMDSYRTYEVQKKFFI
jgi:transcription initiation protein SPT3